MLDKCMSTKEKGMNKLPIKKCKGNGSKVLGREGEKHRENPKGVYYHGKFIEEWEKVVGQVKIVAEVVSSPKCWDQIQEFE